MIDKNLAAYVKHLHYNGYLLQNEVIAAQAIQYNWIVVTVDDAWDMTYDITPLGERALGIQATEGDGDAPVIHFEQDDGSIGSMPIHSTPAPDADTATGYMVDMTRGKPTLVYNGVPINEHGIVLHISDMAKVVRILDEQTSTLREQLASKETENWHFRELVTTQEAELRRAREQVAELERELEIARLARQALEKAIRDAYKHLSDTRLKDYDKIALAEEILRTYADSE